jgi:hypothetical protein
VTIVCKKTLCVLSAQKFNFFVNAMDENWLHKGNSGELDSEGCLQATVQPCAVAPTMGSTADLLANGSHVHC